MINLNDKNPGKIASDFHQLSILFAFFLGCVVVAAVYEFSSGFTSSKLLIFWPATAVVFSCLNIAISYYRKYLRFSMESIKNEVDEE